MIVFSVKYLSSVCRITLSTTNPDSTTPILYSGSPFAVKEVRRLVEKSYGYFGHSVGASTTAIDLCYALFSGDNKEILNPVVEQGKDILSRWSPSFAGSEVS